MPPPPGLCYLVPLDTAARLSVTLALPLKRRSALKVSVARGVITRIGGDFTIVGVGYQFPWF
jgi:hypothetical protein